MNPSIVTTTDGSHTLYLKDLDETYHSTHGAIQESRHVFIEAGLDGWYEENNRAPSILEIGFGTGLNALLACLWARDHINITCTSIEKYPLSKDVSERLNYGRILEADDVFADIIESKWNETTQVREMQLYKAEADAITYAPEAFDICFFDAFGFSKQPELWAIDVLRTYTEGLNAGGVFVTYAARGQLKRDLKALGLIVETLPGPPGKFEMVRAWKA